MKTKYIILLIIAASLTLFGFTHPETKKKKKKTAEPTVIETNINGKGYQLELNFEAGEAHNHPTMAIWIEDLEGNFIQPLYVTASFAQGVYKYGKQEGQKWVSGRKLYQAALPYFIHKWGRDKAMIPSEKHPIPDAYSGATPDADFILKTKTNKKSEQRFRLIIEINQTWDFNEYWHNAKFPDNTDYKTSCQPSIIYAVEIDAENPMDMYVMNPIGHGHYSGDDGKLYTDISTLTTAKVIAARIEVRLK
jgi:hypothetical protein